MSESELKNSVEVWAIKLIASQDYHQAGEELFRKYLAQINFNLDFLLSPQINIDDDMCGEHSIPLELYF